MPKKVSELAQVNPQVTLPAGATALTPVSFVPMSDVTESGHWLGRQVCRLGEVCNGFTPFAEGDVLVAKITPCFENGKGAHAVGLTNGIGFGSTEFHVLRAREGVDPRYVFHVAHSARLRWAAEGYMSGSAGQKRVPREFFDAFCVPDLRLEEQRQIGTVLDALDTTIRRTEAIIEKLKQVKLGLLHDLLTRGIDANGELRPPQSQAPHLYKDSPLGRIPREWRAEPLTALTLGGLMNGVFKEPKRVGHGVPLVNVADLYRGQQVDLARCERFAATTAEIERFGAQRGDIFFTRSSLKLEGIAQTSFLDDDPEGAVFECHVMRLRPNPTLAVARYLKEWCVARHARTHFMRHAKQVTMTTISQDGIRSLRCPVPPLPEQVEAVKRISAVDTRISAEANDLRKARLLKSGLADDLLTGRVRVTPLVA